MKQQKILRSSFMSFYSVVREASPVPKKKPAPKPKKKAESDDDEFPAKTNGTTNGKKADDADFMIVSDSDSDGEFFSLSLFQSIDALVLIIKQGVSSLPLNYS